MRSQIEILLPAATPLESAMAHQGKNRTYTDGPNAKHVPKKERMANEGPKAKERLEATRKRNGASGKEQDIQGWSNSSEES